MSYIKKNIKLRMILVSIIFITGVSYYILFILPPQLETIQLFKDENEVRKTQLTFLEQKVQELPKIKKELNDKVMETQALNNKVPHHQMSMTMMMEIVNYIDAYDFQDIQVLMGDSIIEEKGTSTYNTIPMTITFTAPYSDVTQFLEEMSRSDYMVTVDRFSIDNSIQEEKDESGAFTVSGDTVKVNMLLSLHYMDSGNKEAYPNFMGFSNGADNVFLRPSKEAGDKLVQSNQETSHMGSNERPKDHTHFEIYLTDILRSGDNYSFSGYSPGKDSVYAGMTSEKDITFILTVREDGYTCLIRDADGKEQEQEINIKVKDPSISINSKIQKIMEKMPTIKIQILNYTSDVIKVNMEGTLLETISIYNEKNQIILQGQQVGKIALNR
ncbi:MAG TPA: type 4a pilus biogenesis protein PilO [Epulopiscium sp.]|nr:type 4a pilus biogenesis protein PilO [Candidatus Epulonipiscium sp.]